MAQVRLDKIQASHSGNLESVIHTAVLDNGAVINLGALVAGERELKNVAVPATATLGTEEVLLVAAPEVDYDPRNAGLDHATPIGMAARAYHLVAGDIYTVTDDMISGSTVVGQWVAPANGAIKLAAASALPTTRFIGKVIEKTTLGFNAAPASVIQVVQA